MAKVHILTAFIFILLSNLFSGCFTKKGFISHHVLNKKNIPLCIEMPQTKAVAQNLAPHLHTNLLRHYKRIGYRLTNKSSSAYTLRITISKFDNQHNYVSPDVLLFHSIAVLELQASLLDTNFNVVAEKTFSTSTLLSKPRNPILHSSFVFAKINKNLLQLATQIEQYFRSYLLPKR